jgi:hypothetical protein
MRNKLAFSPHLTGKFLCPATPIIGKFLCPGLQTLCQQNPRQRILNLTLVQIFDLYAAGHFLKYVETLTMEERGIVKMDFIFLIRNASWASEHLKLPGIYFGLKQKLELFRRMHSIE